MSILLAVTCLLLNLRTPSPTDLAASVLLQCPPPSLATPVTVRIATMNVWGVKYQSPYRFVRMPAIGRALARHHPDIVGFQEAFVRADRQALLAPLETAGLPYHRYFRSGLVGSGLLVVSRWPIVEAFFRRYSAGGKPQRIDHGDWWAGKGVALVRIRLPGTGGILDVFVTHAHARYRDDHYDAVRRSNMEELAAFVGESATGTVPAFVLGDFNVRPGESQYDLLVERARLERLMRISSRIDHILAVRTPQYHFDVLETDVIDERIPLGARTIRLSDHKGYLSVVRVTPRIRDGSSLPQD